MSLALNENVQSKPMSGGLVDVQIDDFKDKLTVSVGQYERSALKTSDPREFVSTDNTNVH